MRVPVFVSRLRSSRPTGPSIKRSPVSIPRIAFLLLLALVGGSLPHEARASYVDETITGTVISGTDVSGVFISAGGNLAGYSYTLKITMDDTLGVQSSLACSGGSPTYYTDIYWNSSSSPGVRAVLTINGKSFAWGSYANISTTADAYRYAPTICYSSSTTEFKMTESYDGSSGCGHFYGTSSVGGLSSASTGHSFSSNPSWETAFTSTNLSSSNSIPFSISVTFDTQAWQSAAGTLGTGTGSTIAVSGPYTPSSSLPPAALTYISKNLGNQCLLCGNPLNAGTGNKFQAETDYMGAPSTHLSLTRTYNSYDGTSGPFGVGWHATFFSSISASGSTATVTQEDGRQLVFTQSGSNWVPDADVTSVLTAVMSGGTQIGWKLVLPDDSAENFNMSGQLTSVTTRAGLVTSLTYTSGKLTTVTGPFSQTLTFTYNTAGRIATMTDANSKVYTYAYDKKNNLAAIIYPDTNARGYVYQDPNYPNLLTAILDELGKGYASYTYDSTGRALTSQHAGGADLLTLTYNSGGTVTATDALSNAHTYTLTTGFNLVKPSSLSGTPYPPAGGQTFTYDSNGFVASRTDFDSNVTNYTHDVRGNETQRVEAYGTSLARTISTTWSSTFHLPTQITEPSRTTNFTYDTSGNMLTRSVTDGTHTRTWTYTYNASGQVLTAQDPDSNTTTYTYNTDGTMATAKNALSQTTSFTSYDGNKRLLSKTDPNGLVTSFTYDYKGRMLTRVAGSLTTTYTYDAAGNLTKVTQPDSSYLSYTYDTAHRLTQITDKSGNYIASTLDAMGNRTAVKVYDPSNNLKRTRTYTYDSVNRRASETGATTGETTSYTYDNQSNLLTVTDPLSHVNTYTYDALNRRATAKDPANNTVDFTYDSEDNLTSLDDPRDLTTTYAYNGIGDQTSVASPDTGTTSKTFDAFGNVLTSTDARSDVSTWTYDALNRVATSAYTGGGSATYTYDGGTYGKGHLTGLSDGTGTTSWTYDQLGRVTQKQQVTGTITLTVSYAYDSNGRLSTITYPSTKVATYYYDSNGQVTEITFNGTIAYNVAWMPFGPAKSWTEYSGAALTYGFDQDYRINSIAQGSVNTQTLTWDNANRLTGLTETGLSAKSYSYDSLDRLTGITIGTASPTAYAYDANGNRSSVTDPSSNVTTYNYPSTNNKLSSLSGHVAQSFTYDSNGNMTGDGTNTWTYDQRGRMASNTVSGTTVNYSVDDIGLRVKKAAGTNSYYAYDEGGHELGEYDGSGNPVRETVYLGDIPVGLLGTSGSTTTTYNVAPDWINAPHIVIDGYNHLIWSWDHLAFGDNAPNQNPGGIGTFVYNWRFPGQTYDGESGLFYNMARDYSSTLGRYAESDPFGLAGGDYSIYGYAGVTPLAKVDPHGLQDTVVPDGIPWNLPDTPSSPDITVPDTGAPPTEITPQITIPDDLPETCPPNSSDECKQLNQNVQSAKARVGQLGKCRPGMSPWQLRQRYSAWLAACGKGGFF
jgi:RHS repeat-associated protein